MSTDVDGHPRAVWWNDDGETVVESYTITDMANGTPLGVGDNDERYGAQGAFLIEAGISSSYHIADFFGLTDRVSEAVKRESKNGAKAPVVPSAATASLHRRSLPHCGRGPPVSTKPQPQNQSSRRRSQPNQSKRRSGGIDVGAVITRALTAAGLMK
jgi:feruloyl esterase